MSLKYTKPEHLSLKNHADFNEAWLQERIAEDPSILGLGEIELLERERSQGRAGRLDLLLSDPDQARRYEVELMLGATDPSHVIRCIEYWDIERRRYPAYDHIAVLVAEDITSRFLNVLALFSGSIPLIAIQLNALQVGDSIVLDFVRVLDQAELRTDDEEEAGERAPADRAYWAGKAGPDVMALMDSILDMINETAEPRQSLNYNRYFVGLSDGQRSRNFIYFRPRRKHARLVVPSVTDEKLWLGRFEEAGLDASIGRKGALRVNLTGASFKAHQQLIREFVHGVVTAYQEA